jgi:hypothetical protein
MPAQPGGGAAPPSVVALRGSRAIGKATAGSESSAVGCAAQGECGSSPELSSTPASPAAASCSVHCRKRACSGEPPPSGAAAGGAVPGCVAPKAPTVPMVCARRTEGGAEAGQPPMCASALGGGGCSDPKGDAGTDVMAGGGSQGRSGCSGSAEGSGSEMRGTPNTLLSAAATSPDMRPPAGTSSPAARASSASQALCARLAGCRAGQDAPELTSEGPQPCGNGRTGPVRAESPKPAATCGPHHSGVWRREGLLVPQAMRLRTAQERGRLGLGMCAARADTATTAARHPARAPVVRSARHTSRMRWGQARAVAEAAVGGPAGRAPLHAREPASATDHRRSGRGSGRREGHGAGAGAGCADHCAGSARAGGGGRRGRVDPRRGGLVAAAGRGLAPRGLAQVLVLVVVLRKCRVGRPSVCTPGASTQIAKRGLHSRPCR